MIEVFGDGDPGEQAGCCHAAVDDGGRHGFGNYGFATPAGVLRADVAVHEEFGGFCITSSAFYWPWAFADGDPLSFVHDSKLEGDDFDVNDDVIMSYKAYGFEQDDNFTRIDIVGKEIVVQNYDRNGKALGSKTKVTLA